MRRLWPKSIFAKFTIVFVAAGLLPLAFFTGVTLNRFADSARQSAFQSAEQVLGAVADSLSSQIYDLNRQTTNMYRYPSKTSGSLYDILKKKTLNHLAGIAYDTETLNAMKDFTNSVIDSHASIRNVIFLPSDGGAYASQLPYSKNLIQDYDFLGEDVIKRALLAPRELHVSLPHKESYYQRSEETVITFCRVLLDMNDLPIRETPVGVLLIDVPYGFLKDAFSKFDWSALGVLNVCDDSGTVIFSSNGMAIGEEAPEDIKQLIGKSQTREQGQDIFLSQTIDKVHWNVIYRMNTGALLKDVHALQRFAALMIAISAIGALVMAMLFSRLMTKPIQQLLKQMKRVTTGDLSARIESARTDEIGELQQGFNQMVVDLNTYIEKSFLARLKQQEAEMNELKMQIHPHFMYNTLEVIRMSALEKNDTITADMIKSLAKLLKYIISELKDMVPLKYEIEMVRDYITLVSLRYGDIRMETQVEPDLYECLVPKLCLQPLIENAVQHGLRPKGGGKICLNAQSDGQTLTCTILDDGVGMDEAHQKRLADLLVSDAIGEKTEHGWNSIGLKNVNDRAKLAFGEAYGLRIDSLPGIGTAVTLTLPKEVQV